MRLDRLNEMENYVLQKGTASLDDLAEKFAVSLNTVRRDVLELLKRGQLKKVYGGVSSLNAKTLLPMSIRAERQYDSKLAIGKMAATLVQDNTTIFLDSGSTTIHLLPYITGKNNITVITHSLSALYEAAKYPDLNVIALGGQYSQPTSSYVGLSTLQMLSTMSIDIIFIAATGVSIEKGMTNNTYFEAEIKRSVTSGNKNIILMADHTKFDRAALFTFCDLNKMSAVVSDTQLPEQYVQYFAQHNIAVHLADPQGE